MMIIRRFLQWAKTASPGQRSEGASALARAYLYADLEEPEREEAEQALTSLLDDPSPLVRRALAESFAGAADAPHHLLLALANDQSDVSSIVLARSLALSDSELIDCAAIGDAIAQSAIALRHHVSASVAAALAEVGAREALVSLANNPGATLLEFSLRRMMERFYYDGELRQALLSRTNLPSPLRADLVLASVQALATFLTERDWISEERARRVTHEARERAHIIIAATAKETDGPRKLAAHLRSCGQLTASLLLRALLSGNESLFAESLAELTDLAAERIRGLMRDWKSAGFAALYARATLPSPLLPAFRAALEALYMIETDDHSGARLSRQRVERVLTSCATFEDHEFGKLMALLRRFEAEAARDDARDFANALPDRSPVPAIEPPQNLPQQHLREIPSLLLHDRDHASEARKTAAHVPASHVRRIEPRLVLVDLEALEAELVAA